MFKKLFIVSALICSGNYCFAHGFSGNGFMHPLTGMDHILAMVAVGAWSAQLGGKALYLVPGSFLIAMLAGGIAGAEIIPIETIESVIALSVLLLGLAIWINKKVSVLIAGLAVGIFGFSHGYSHGLEMLHTVNALDYIVGFIITTLGLHIIGAIGGLLILEEMNGPKHLRILGAITSFIGVYLLLR